MHQTAFSHPAERNKRPILEVLKAYIKNDYTVLEIGSGTGQHIDYFSKQLPRVYWQPSNPDCSTLMTFNSNNTLLPIALDVNLKEQWPTKLYDCIYTANTSHIMSWSEVLLMIELIASNLNPNGYFICYGPFVFNDRQTMQSNLDFDADLKEKKSTMGLRNFDDIKNAALKYQLEVIHIHDMPANNNMLIFKHKV